VKGALYENEDVRIGGQVTQAGSSRRELGDRLSETVDVHVSRW
jgi:hypothetical protein